MLDSGEFLEDAELDDAACPCGSESFDVAVGFALRSDEEESEQDVRCRLRSSLPQGAAGRRVCQLEDRRRSLRYLLDAV